MLRKLVTAVLLLFPALAAAHDRGVSLVEVDVRGAEVDLALAFHAEELGSFDADGDGALAAPEVEAAADRIAAASLRRVGLFVGAEACVRGAPAVAPDPLGGVRVTGTFRCPADATAGIDLALGYLEALPPGHRAVGEARFGDRVIAFTADAASRRIALHGEAGGGFFRFFALGIEHIFTGFDHLLFLAGLLIVAARVAEVARLVTTFTIAHSLTLAAAVLGLVDLPSRVVEPLIAASIVFVAVENLVRRDHRGREVLTFVFGLVHGFGFAGLLRELGMGRGSLAITLAGFNLGVEAGQLAVVLAVAPLLLLSRKQPWYARTAVPGFSAVIGFFGAYWLVQRLAGG